MFKFIKNLFGLGQKSNTVTANEVISEIADITGVTLVKDVNESIPFIITLEDCKTKNSFIKAFRQAKEDFNKYHGKSLINRNGRFSGGKEMSFCRVKTYDKNVNIEILVFPTDKSTTGYNLIYVGSISETQSNIAKTRFNVDDLYKAVCFLSNMTKLNG